MDPRRDGLREAFELDRFRPCGDVGRCVGTRHYRSHGHTDPRGRRPALGQPGVEGVRAARGDLGSARELYWEIEGFSVGDPVVAVHLACARVELDLAAGHRDAARAALVEAEALDLSAEKGSFYEELVQARQHVAEAEGA